MLHNEFDFQTVFIISSSPLWNDFLKIKELQHCSLALHLLIYFC